jgi:hypothetical protein
MKNGNPYIVEISSFDVNPQRFFCGRLIIHTIIQYGRRRSQSVFTVLAAFYLKIESEISDGR